VPKKHLPSTVYEDVTELPPSRTARNRVKRAAYSVGLAVEDQLEPSLAVDEARSSRFLAVEGATVSFGKGEARIWPLRGVSLERKRVVP